MLVQTPTLCFPRNSGLWKASFVNQKSAVTTMQRGRSVKWPVILNQVCHQWQRYRKQRHINKRNLLYMAESGVLPTCSLRVLILKYENPVSPNLLKPPVLLSSVVVLAAGQGQGFSPTFSTFLVLSSLPPHPSFRATLVRRSQCFHPSIVPQSSVHPSSALLGPFIFPPNPAEWVSAWAPSPPQTPRPRAPRKGSELEENHKYSWLKLQGRTNTHARTRATLFFYVRQQLGQVGERQELTSAWIVSVGQHESLKRQERRAKLFIIWMFLRSPSLHLRVSLKLVAVWPFIGSESLSASKHGLTQAAGERE